MLEKFYPKLSDRWKGYFSIFGSFLIYFTIGMFYLWSTINIYAVSYYKIQGETNLDNSSGVIFFPIFALSQKISGLGSLNLIDKIGVSKTCLLWGFLLSISTIVSSYMSSMMTFLFFFAFLEGVITGLLWIIPVHCCFPYFPRNRGIVNGILQTGFGIGGVVYNGLAFKLINPDNHLPISKSPNEEPSFGPEVAFRLPNFIRVIGVYQFCLILLAALALFDPPKKKHSIPKIIVSEIVNKEVEITQSLLENNKEEPGSGLKQTKDSSMKNELISVDLNVREDDVKSSYLSSNFKYPETVKEALCSHIFIFTFIMSFISTGTTFMVSVNIKNYGITVIPDDQFITMVASLSSFFNGATRMLWGVLYDKYGFKYLFGISLIVQIFLLSIYCATAHIGALFAINNVIMLCLRGLYLVIFTPMWSHVFHPKIATKMVLCGSFSPAFSTLLQYFIQFFLIGLIGYSNILLIEVGLLVLCLIVLWRFEMPPNFE